jgi:hypothetical protein
VTLPPKVVRGRALGATRGIAANVFAPAAVYVARTETDWEPKAVGRPAPLVPAA